MKTKMFYCMIVILITTTPSFADQSMEQGKEKMYLAHNIWLKRGVERCINYKTGRLLPAGTEVKDAKLVDSDPLAGSLFQMEDKKINFFVKETGKWIQVGFVDKWHPGKTIDDCYDKMFTTSPFEELVAGFNQTEIEAIKAGRILPGMSKKAVLAAYGPPPEHETPDLSSPSWMYWDNIRKRHEICFGSDDRTIDCRFQGSL